LIHAALDISLPRTFNLLDEFFVENKMKKTALWCLMLFCAALMLFPGTVRAEGEKTYVTAKLGKFHPWATKFDRPIGYEAAVGRNFSENFTLELGYGQYVISHEDDGNRPFWLSLDKPPLGKWKEERSYEITPMLLTAKFVSSNDYSVAFLGLGVGAYHVRSDVKLNASMQQNYSYTETDTLYGYHVEMGIGYNTRETIYLGVNLRYSFMDHTDMDRRVYGKRIGGEDNLNGYFFMGEVSFKF
jgi:outer membrane protein W